MKSKLLMVGGMMVAGAAMASEGMNLGGYVDARYGWDNTKGTNKNTFYMAEGAVYLGKKVGMGEVMVDVPFKGAQSDNSFVLGQDQAQAWISWKYDNGFMWKLGQFDAIYGMESNDSVDNFFAGDGLLAGEVPTTHTGLMIGYDLSDSINLGLLVANHSSAKIVDDTLVYQSPGVMPGGHGNPDVGFTLGTKMDGYHAKVGGLFTRMHQSDTMNWTFDIVAGTEMADLKIDLEAIVESFNEESGFSIGAQAVYSWSEMVKLGLRVENRKDATTFATAKAAGVSDSVATDAATLTQITVGPSFMMNKDFSVRLAYNYVMSAVEDSDAVSSIGLSAVHRF